MKRIAKLILITAVIAVVGTNAFAETWEYVPGTNKNINKIFSPPNEPNRIIVASDGEPTDILLKEVVFPYTGSGCQESIDSGKTFGTYFLTGMPVYDIYASKLNPDFWMAAVRKFDRGGVFQSLDGGATWNDTIPLDGVPQIYRLSSSVQDGEEVYVAGAIQTSDGFIISDNGFYSYQQSSGVNVEARAIAYSKSNPNLLFIAGDSYSYGRVLRSYNNGGSWEKDVSGLEGLRILSILPSSINPAIVFCGADSVATDKSSIGKGVFMSIDTGKTWRSVGGAGAQVFEIVEHPRFPKYIAAAAGLQGVLVSSVHGLWFEQYNSGLPITGSVRNVLIPDWDTTSAGCITFAGVLGEGLFKSTYITSDINDFPSNDAFSFVSISPQPASDFVQFVWNNPQEQTASLRIFDSFGREVYAMNNAFFPEGQNTFSWNIAAGNYPSGVYFIEVATLSGSIFNKFIKL